MKKACLYWYGRLRPSGKKIVFKKHYTHNVWGYEMDNVCHISSLYNYALDKPLTYKSLVV